MSTLIIMMITVYEIICLIISTCASMSNLVDLMARDSLDCDTPNFRGSLFFFLVISALSAMISFSEIM